MKTKSKTPESTNTKLIRNPKDAIILATFAVAGYQAASGFYHLGVGALEYLNSKIDNLETKTEK